MLISGEYHVAGAGMCENQEHQGSILSIDHMRCVSFFSNSISGELEVRGNSEFSGFIINSNQDSTKHNTNVWVENNNLIVVIDSGYTAGKYILSKVSSFENPWDNLKPLYN